MSHRRTAPKKSTVVTVLSIARHSRRRRAWCPARRSSSAGHRRDPARRSCRPASTVDEPAVAAVARTPTRSESAWSDSRVASCSPDALHRVVAAPSATSDAIVRAERPRRTGSTSGMVPASDCRRRRPRSRGSAWNGSARISVTTPTFVPLGDATASRRVRRRRPSARPTNDTPSARHTAIRASSAPPTGTTIHEPSGAIAAGPSEPSADSTSTVGAEPSRGTRVTDSPCSRRQPTRRQERPSQRPDRRPRTEPDGLPAS